MIHRPIEVTAFEFVVVASQRAAQLMRGCLPRVAPHSKPEVTAQREVAAGKVRALPRATDGANGRANGR
jgi:DNA-directed RNA polymerase subunit K/omega